LKPGKRPNELTSYRPISHLPVVSKVFEKLLLKRLLQIVEMNRLIPNHQFGFRQRHSTIEQIHRVVGKVNEALLSIQQSMAYWISVQVNMVFPSELFPYSKILYVGNISL
jgi:hypothetical protein